MAPSHRQDAGMHVELVGAVEVPSLVILYLPGTYTDPKYCWYLTCFKLLAVPGNHEVKKFPRRVLCDVVRLSRAFELMALL